MQWLFAALAGIGFVELVIRLPVMRTFGRYRDTVLRAMAVMRSRRISDHWKEHVLPRYALRMFRQTMALAAYGLAAFFPFLLLSAVSAAMGVPFLKFTLSVTGLLFITAVSLAYTKLRSSRVTAKL